MPAFRKNPGYDMGKDFAPIGLIASVPIVIMSNPSVPAKSLSEMIALAKKDGDKVTVGTPPAPTLNYFGAEQFKAMTGTNITIVTYKGTGPLTNDLVGGHVMFAFNTLPPAIGNIRAGGAARHCRRITDAHGCDPQCSRPSPSPACRASRSCSTTAWLRPPVRRADHRTAEQGAAQDRHLG